jgi:lysyl-tRNA synthetase class 2
MNELKQVRIDKLALLQEDYNSWEVNTSAEELKSYYSYLESGTEEPNHNYYIAGRVIAKRVFGKLAFITLKDSTGDIQLYIEKAYLEADIFDTLVKQIDLGDILGVAAYIIKKTDKGEISLKPYQIVILTKALLPLPDKYKGLVDIETRYRQRYLDLITNDTVKNTFIKRSKVIKGIRDYLDDRNYIEVETPILTSEVGGADAKPFITHHNSLDKQLYMRIATELHLKRLLVGGFDSIYEIGKIFRNEGISTKHNPEFTSIEIYKTYENYEYMLSLTENLITHLANHTDTEYQGNVISMSKPWKRISMVDVVKEYTNLDFDEFNSLEEAVQATQELGIESDVTTLGELLNLVFEEKVESNLVQPTFITDYPEEVSPLARSNPNNPGYTERFELFICGMEIANGFSELNNPIIQRERFEAQLANKDNELATIDEDFITALEYGMPPSAGLGIGIDRLVMLLTNSSSIKDVILFPLLK